MYSLLYVDDEPGLLEITKLFLERKGNFSVDTAVSATDALRLPGIASYDAIVADYQMPGMDGIAFLKEVRQKLGDIPFILFTGRGREEVVIEAINNGADFYLQKGGDPSAQFAELAHKVRQAIARRNAERSLVESEKRLADIINFLPDATFAIDRSGRVIAWNRAIEGMTGVPAAQMMGKGDYEYAVPFYGKRRPILIDLISEPDEKIAGFYSGIIREGSTLTAETDLPHPKGIRINVLAKASPLYNREGGVVGAIESIRDITGIKHAEDDLSRARKDWETIFRAIGHPAFVLDAENRIIDANDATLAATGKTLAGLKGLHCYEVFHVPGTEQPPPGCPFEQVNAPGSIGTGETEIAALDGYYAVTCTPVYGADGKLEKVIHIAMDVTARRKDADELRAAYEQMTATEEQLRANFEDLAAHEKRLRENETKFRAVFEKSHDALVLFTKDGCIDCNRHAVELFGYNSREELLGLTPLDTSAPVQPDGRTSAVAAEDHIRTAKEQGADRFEWLQQRKDGTTFPAEILLSGYVLDGKEVFLSSIRDITRRKRAESEIHALSMELQQIFRNMINAFVVFESVFNERGEYVSFRFGRFNDAYARIAKVTYEEVKGKDIFEVWPGTEQSWVETFGKIATTGVSNTFDMYHGPTKGWYRCNAYRPTDSPDKICVIFEDITERKKTEDALIQANIVVENSPAVIFRWKAEDGWPVVYVSQNVSLFGYTPEELVRGDFPYSTLVYPGDLNQVAGEVDRFTREGTDRFRQQYRVVTRAGDVRWVDDFTVIERDAGGRVTHYQGILIDVTDRKRMEDALKKRLVALTRPLEDTGIAFEDLFDPDEIQRLQDDFANATGVAVLLTRPDGTPITRPSNFCRLCGEIVRRTPAGREKCFRSDSTLGRLHEGGPYIHTCLSAGLWGAGTSIVLGGRHIANWLIGQVRDERQTEEGMRAYAREIGVNEEDFVQAFLEVPVMSAESFASVAQSLHTLADQLSKSAYQNIQQARFIMDRKRAEEALRESEEKYRHILENMQDAYIRVDENGTITMVSPSAVRMYGYGSVEEMTGIPVESLYVRYGQQREELIRRLRENRGVTDFTGEAVRKDGSVFWVSVSAQFLRDETGRIVGTEGVVRDISERKAMERALQDANKKLTLLNTITRHDLANKAAIITGLAQAAQFRKPGQDAATADILKKIEAAGADIAAQIAFTKSYQELGVHAPAWQNVREIVARQKADGIAITCTCEAEIYADPMFQKVIANLADNAVRHGERVSKMTVSCEPGRGGLVITVADNGVGVPDELKEKIFERGFGKHTGFGLFLAREILAITGITIRETGTPGEGARFEMVVPEGGTGECEMQNRRNNNNLTFTPSVPRTF